jgi:formylglycine-generating enzyme required for sulfatase activity
LLATLAFVTPLLIRLSYLIPEGITTFNNTPTATIGSTSAFQPSTNSTEAFIPLEIHTPSPTSTEIFVASPTSLPTEITDFRGVPMVLVPAGEFTMGSETGESDEKPVHQVYLDAFYIDIYEVTNAAYKACEDAGKCNSPKQTGSFTRSRYYGNSQYDDNPVIYVDWNMAKTYCEWRAGKLPTEAQWEKAARGTDERIYPWNSGIDSRYANYNSYVGDTVNVGNYEDGKSIYGVYDMAGNVWEWIADLYDSRYYQSSYIESNPQGPYRTDQQYVVIRGGSWDSGVIHLRVSNRDSYLSNGYSYKIGFRCVRSAIP